MTVRVVRYDGAVEVYTDVAFTSVEQGCLLIHKTRTKAGFPLKNIKLWTEDN